MIRLRAVLEMFTRGTDRARTEAGQINRELEEAANNAARMNRSLAQTRTGRGAMERAGVSETRQYRTQRGVTEARGAEGRNFAAMARGGAGEGFVAAYATLAANLFAVTAAFQALNNAAKTEQLTQGLEIMGARSGVSLKLLSSNLKEVTDNAISTADSMRVVAQASAAGMSSEEIEKMGKVARGASLALGRDMNDSIDRLTRGITKLEPELLDEIGIMVRLDDAVKVYAKQNNIAASSLTNLQRRQAFANAVLEEGERKFGAINDQIDSNPYDKLSSALRDLGTEITKLANDVLLPFIKLITEVPILGLVPALGVLSQTLSKVMPTLDSFYDKLGGRIGSLETRRNFISSLIPEAEEQFMRAPRGSQDERESLNEVNRLRSQELNLQTQINSLGRQQIILENFRETQRTRGTIAALRELAIAKAQLATDTSRLGVQEHITNLTKFRIAMSVLSGAVETLMTALSRVLIAITLITAAISLATVAFKYFFPPTEAEERLKKYKEQMKELVDSAKDVRTQLQYLSAGEGQDALVNSSLALIDNLKKQKRIEAEIALERKLASANIEALYDPSLGNVMAANAVVLSQAFGGRILKDSEKIANELEKLPDEAKELYLALKDVLPQQAAIVRSAMKEGKSRQEVLDLLIMFEPQLRKLDDINASLVESAKAIVEEWDKLKIKDFDTGFTKINAEFQDIAKTVSQLDEPLNTATIKSIFDSLNTVGIDKLQATLGAAQDIGVKINPEDKVNLENFINNLKSIQELEIKIKAGGFIEGFEGLIQQIINLELETINLAPKVAEAAAKISQSAEDILVTNLINEKIAANTAAVNAASLEIEKKRLDMTRKKADALNDIIGVSIKEDTLIKSMVDSARLLKDAEIARKKAINDILALEKNQSNLNLQKQTASGNELKFIESQIRSNKELIDIKTEQANLDAQAAKEAFDISIQRASVLTNNIILAQSETTLLGQGAEITAELLSAENARLAVVDKKLANLKEELSLQSQLRDAQLTTARQIAEAEAAKRGGSISAQTERNLSITAAENTLANLEDEKELLAKEKNLMLEKMKLEQLVLGIRLAAAEQELTNAINSAPEGTDTTMATAAVEQIGEARGILGRLFIDEKAILEEQFATREEILDTQIQGQKAVLDALPKSAREVADRLIEGLKGGLGAALGGIGLTGAAADFYARESQGIINSGMSKEDQDAALANIRSMSSEIQGQQILVEGLQGIYSNLTSGIENAFMAMIDGSKSAKEAFGEMAAAIIKDIAAMIIKMLVFRAVQAGLNMLLPGLGTGVSAGSNIATRAVHATPGSNTRPFANGGLIALANGGIMDARGGVQGIVSKPTYLVGEGRYNEAVVPLPNGKAIPVQMHGGGQSNNVSVNVNISNSGQVQTETQGQDMGNLGQAIAVAVQKELIAQKMPGGILNRYGAA